MDRETRRRYFNLCDPEETLGPDDPRNVDLDATTSLALAPRGFPWVQDISEKLELSDSPLQLFFTGLPGSGKSTELRRLAKLLESSDGPHLFPAHIDAERLVDLDKPLDVPEILMAVLFGTEQLVLELERRDPGRAAHETLIGRMWHWFNHTELTVEQLKANASAGFKFPSLGGAVDAQATAGISASVALKTDASLRQRVREAVSAALPRFLAEVSEAMRALEARVKVFGYEGLVVLFDSLEKLRGLSTEWENVLKSAEGLFDNGAPYLKLPVHVVYTVPAALTFRVNMPRERLFFLPMLKLTDRHDVPFEPGLEAARALIRARVPDASNRLIIDQLFRNNVLLRYCNREAWYDVHPSVLELREVQLEVERLKAELEAPAER